MESSGSNCGSEDVPLCKSESDRKRNEIAKNQVESSLFLFYV